jgi:predicted GTPase
LCNALFGQDICSISDVQACTRDPQEVFLSIGSGAGLKLLDVPGVGESSERDKEYEELYEKLAVFQFCG